MSITAVSNGRDSGLVGWTVRGSNSGGDKQDFRHSPTAGLGPTKSLVHLVTFFFPWGKKQPGRGSDEHPI